MIKMRSIQNDKESRDTRNNMRTRVPCRYCRNTTTVYIDYICIKKYWSNIIINYYLNSLKENLGKAHSESVLILNEFQYNPINYNLA